MIINEVVGMQAGRDVVAAQTQRQTKPCPGDDELRSAQLG